MASGGAPVIKYCIRWRGHMDGPLSLREIDRRLDAGQLGMLTEIEVEAQWITLREFYQIEGDKLRRSEPATRINTSPAVQPLPTLSDRMPNAVDRNSKTKRTLILAGIATSCILVALAGAFLAIQRAKTTARAGKNSTGATPERTESKPGSAITATPPVRTNGTAATSQFPATIPTNQLTVGTSYPPTTNEPPAEQIPVVLPIVSDTPTEPAFPEGVSRMFYLANSTTLTGTIVSVTEQGLIIRDIASKYSSRVPWENFDLAALGREPKVIAFRNAKEQARLTKDRARIAVEQAVAQAKARQEEGARSEAEYRARQDAKIATSIADYGWKSVTTGHLKAWGSEVSIGAIFTVVAPRAQWSADKLVDYDAQRYTHYLVEAKWTNEKGQRVAMQYLVTANGLNFQLHGCFVSGEKMDDLPFLMTVKNIWNRGR